MQHFHNTRDLIFEALCIEKDIIRGAVWLFLDYLLGSALKVNSKTATAGWGKEKCFVIDAPILASFLPPLSLVISLYIFPFVIARLRSHTLCSCPHSNSRWHFVCTLSLKNKSMAMANKQPTGYLPPAGAPLGQLMPFHLGVCERKSMCNHIHTNPLQWQWGGRHLELRMALLNRGVAREAKRFENNCLFHQAWFLLNLCTLTEVIHL